MTGFSESINMKHMLCTSGSLLVGWRAKNGVKESPPISLVQLLIFGREWMAERGHAIVEHGARHCAVLSALRTIVPLPPLLPPTALWFSVLNIVVVYFVNLWAWEHMRLIKSLAR